VTGWRNYRGNLAFFAEHFRCLVVEFPGFGVSDDFGGHPMLDAQSAVPAFVDALGLERVDVIGNSMGGWRRHQLRDQTPGPDRQADHYRRGSAPTSTAPDPAREFGCCRSSPKTPPGSDLSTGSTRWSTTRRW